MGRFGRSALIQMILIHNTQKRKKSHYFLWFNRFRSHSSKMSMWIWSLYRLLESDSCGMTINWLWTWIKHKLGSNDILNDDGTLNEKAQILVGEDRFICAKDDCTKRTKELSSLEKSKTKIPMLEHSERTDASRTKLSLQWFLKNGRTSPKPGIRLAVMDDVIQTYPPKVQKNHVRSWMEMFRGLVYFPPQTSGWRTSDFLPTLLPNGEYVVAKIQRRSFILANQKFGMNLLQRIWSKMKIVLDTLV